MSFLSKIAHGLQNVSPLAALTGGQSNQDGFLGAVGKIAKSLMQANPVGMAATSLEGTASKVLQAMGANSD